MIWPGKFWGKGRLGLRQETVASKSFLCKTTTIKFWGRSKSLHPRKGSVEKEVLVACWVHSHFRQLLWEGEKICSPTLPPPPNVCVVAGLRSGLFGRFLVFPPLLPLPPFFLFLLLFFSFLPLPLLLFIVPETHFKEAVPQECKCVMQFNRKRVESSIWLF